MIIAVNTRFLQKDYPEEYGYFLHETFSRITKNHPEHEFIFIFDQPCDQRFIYGANVKPVITGPSAGHPLLWKYWYDLKVPAVLKKYKADVFVSGNGVCSLPTNVPQCLVVHDLDFLHSPSSFKKTHVHFYKKYLPKFLSKAASIATVSVFSKKDIIDQYKINPADIDVVFKGVSEFFKPVTEDEKTATKKTYTDGKEYFIYSGGIHPGKNLINLLKAFSVFKKRQQTNMKLVLAGRVARNYNSFTQSLQSYKFRNDVVMTGSLDEAELVKLLGSAYGLVYPSLYESFGVPVLEAMRCAVPVITSVNSAMEEITKEAALYADAGSHTDIADKMMLLYKDENLRKNLVQKGVEAAHKYNWDKTADLLWQCIVKAYESVR